MQAGILAKTVTTEIKQTDNLAALSDIVNQWGSSFDHIHTSAVFSKAANLAGKRQVAGSQQKLLVALLSKLSSIWASVQPDAQARGLCNVLWASSKLGYHDSNLWSSTLAAFRSKIKIANCRQLCNVAYAMATATVSNRGSVPGCAREEVQQTMHVILGSVYVIVTNPQLEDVTPQDLSNFLWALSKLQIHPGQPEIAAIVRAVVKQQMLEQSTPQHVATVLYAFSELRDRCNLRTALAQRSWQQLLGDRQLAQIARSRVPQDVANTLLALARLTSSNVMDSGFGQNRAAVLLQSAPSWDLTQWTAQNISNSLWACDKLHLADESFLKRVADAAEHWVPQSIARNVAQAATALGNLQYRDQPLMTALARRSMQLLQHSPKSDRSDLMNLTVAMGLSIAQLDMYPLAVLAVELLQSTTRRRQEILRPVDAGRLYKLHEWLVRNQLLDGRGLVGLLSAEQLAEGKESAKRYQMFK